MSHQAATKERNRDRMTSIDETTRHWIFNAADERAAAKGARFSIARAAWAVYWIQANTSLYEGEYAGQPLILRGAHSAPLIASPQVWDKGGRQWQIDRLEEYIEAVQGGEASDWQLPTIARLFGWLNFSQRWKSYIRRFNRGSIFVAKKNKKSPTLAAVAWYLMCGDGEPGMKVFLCATNGNQARDIAGRHAVEMLNNSPRLQEVCHIDKARMRITHTPTKSMMQPLASGNVRTQKAAEGLNGTALIDEIHVVDKPYVSRICRMGASRKEPFILSFSTAGNDMDSYGFQEWQYGTQNNKTGSDEHYFFESYEAPQGLADSELAKNFDKYVLMANPAAGHTIDIDEVRQDYNASKIDQRKLAEFKQYRLNIWSRTATPWIALDDWSRGDSAADQPTSDICWGALEVGYVDEPSAFTLVWPNDHFAIDEAIASKKPLLELLGALDQPVRSKTWYWLPRGAVDRFQDSLPYAEWEHAGLATIQDSNVIDFNCIVADISAIISKYDVQAIGFAPWKSATVMNHLRTEDGYPEERCWEFLERSPAAWAFPCALFERLIIAGRLEHQASAILDWELGHATIKTDRQGGVSLVKPERGDTKTVNGVASLIMALDAMARAPRHYRSELVMFGGSPGKAKAEKTEIKTPPRGRLIQEYWQQNGRMPTPTQVQELIESQ